MKERPILFNAPMVRAIIDGRKTHARMAVKQQPSMERDCEPEGYSWVPMHKGRELSHHQCPYGQPGDSLWVRETWNARPVLEVDSGMYEAWEPYEAIPKQQPSNAWVYFEADGDEEGPWRPSIHMPRCASRIQLEITGIRVERLQDISEDDAIDEGIEGALIKGVQYWRDYRLTDEEAACSPMLTSPFGSYRTLWESINGPGSWEANPWVWVIEFRRIKP